MKNYEKGAISFAWGARRKTTLSSQPGIDFRTRQQKRRRISYPGEGEGGARGTFFRRPGLILTGFNNRGGKEIKYIEYSRRRKFLAKNVLSLRTGTVSMSSIEMKGREVGSKTGHQRQLKIDLYREDWQGNLVRANGAPEVVDCPFQALVL